MNGKKAGGSFPTEQLGAAQKVFYDRYTLVNRLGRGGMAVVWLARDSYFRDAQVALKFLPDELVVEPQHLDLLMSEAQITLRLTHPNIVRTYDLAKDPQADLAAISMEFIEGETMRARRESRALRCFGPSELRPWLSQMFSALHYAHEANIIHRDLKPANIMLGPATAAHRDGVVKISDFGIAAPITEQLTHMDTRWNHIARAGTSAYMSPQQRLVILCQVEVELWRG